MMQASKASVKCKVLFNNCGAKCYRCYWYFDALSMITMSMLTSNVVLIVSLLSNLLHIGVGTNWSSEGCYSFGCSAF